MTVTLPTFTPRSDWTPPKLDELPSWDGASRVAYDLETRDPQLTELGPGVRREGSYVVGISFAIEGGPAAYLPIAHDGGGNLDPAKVWAYLKDQAKVFTGDLCGANLPYDMDWSAESGVVFRRVRYFRDVQIAEPLIDDNQFTYALDAIAARRGVPGKSEALLRAAAAAYGGIDPKKDMWRLPATFVGGYAEQDARLPLTLLTRQERDIEEQDLWEVYNMESRLLPVLVKMRRRGVRIDFDELDRVEHLSVVEQQKLLDEIHRQTNVRVGIGDMNKTALLAEVLEEIGVKLPLTATGKKSVTAPFLETLDHSVAAMIRQAKQWDKLRNTFVAGRRQHAIGDRVHPTFNQLRGPKPGRDSGDEGGARYGRLSCSDPNLQQEPNRGFLKKIWRKVYIPDEGGEWACLDFSQQEPRWLTHYAALQKFPKAEEARDRYINDPSTDNHNMMSELTGLPRDDAKELFLGRCYGMGGGKLCIKLGLPTEYKVHKRSGNRYLGAGPEGQAILDQFDEKAPYVRRLDYECRDRANRRGYIITAGGRRCRFPRHPSGRGYDWVHLALNRLIQGSSGDQTKKAMVDADDAGFPLQLQVHDELDLTIGDRQQSKDLAEIMLNAVECTVPHKVDAEHGPSWGEIE